VALKQLCSGLVVRTIVQNSDLGLQTELSTPVGPVYKLGPSEILCSFIVPVETANPAFDTRS